MRKWKILNVTLLQCYNVTKNPPLPQSGKVGMCWVKETKRQGQIAHHHTDATVPHIVALPGFSFLALASDWSRLHVAKIGISLQYSKQFVIFSLSNSDCKGKNEADNFFDVLYGEYNRARIYEQNGTPNIVIRNYSKSSKLWHRHSFKLRSYGIRSHLHGSLCNNYPQEKC